MCCISRLVWNNIKYNLRKSLVHSNVDVSAFQYRNHVCVNIADSSLKSRDLSYNGEYTIRRIIIYFIMGERYYFHEIKLQEREREREAILQTEKYRIAVIWSFLSQAQRESCDNNCSIFKRYPETHCVENRQPLQKSLSIKLISFCIPIYRSWVFLIWKTCV